MAKKKEIARTKAPPKSRRAGSLVVALSVGLFIGLSALGWRTYDRHAEVARYLPPKPLSLPGNPMLSNYLDEAEKTARNYWSAAEGLAQLSRIYQANGFLAEASQALEGLGHIEPRNPRWPYRLATILAGYGRLETAVPLFHRTAKLTPEYLPAQLRLAEALLKSGNSVEAAQVFTAVSTHEPSSAYALLGLARIDFASRRWSEAQEKLLRITQADPDFSPAWSLLVTVYDELGNGVAATEARARSTNSGLRMMPDPWLDELMADCFDPYRLNVAAAATARTDSTGAIRLLQLALRIDPSNATSHRLLGEELKKIGDTAGARQHLGRATQLEPTVDLNWLTLIVFLNSEKKFTDSGEALMSGLSYCPDSPGLLMEQARRLSAQGRFAEEIPLLLRLQKIDPRESEHRVGLALVLFRLGEIEKGMEQMQQALTLKPDHPIALLALARNAIQSHDEPAALSFIARLRVARQIRPTDLNRVLDDYREQFKRSP